MVTDAIYTFKKLKHYKPFSDTFFQIAKLSIESAKKFYTTILYADSASKEFLESNGLEFDKVVILPELEELETLNYGLPKMIAMAARKEPYVHLDFDTILFNKLNSVQQVAFAFPEIELLYNVGPEALNSLVHGYLNSYNAIEQNLSKEQKAFLHWDKIPSNCVLYVNDPDLVRGIFNKSIDLWYRGNEDKISPALLEQQLLFSFLKNKKAEYQFFTDVNRFSMDNYLQEVDKLKYLHSFDFIHLYDYPEREKDIPDLIFSIKQLLN